jgi:hypothetical protein
MFLTTQVTESASWIALPSLSSATPSWILDALPYNDLLRSTFEVTLGKLVWRKPFRSSLTTPRQNQTVKKTHLLKHRWRFRVH